MGLRDVFDGLAGCQPIIVPDQHIVLFVSPRENHTTWILQTARGVGFPLGVLCSGDLLREHLGAINEETVRRMLMDEMARTKAMKLMDPLAYWTYHIVEEMDRYDNGMEVLQARMSPDTPTAGVPECFLMPEALEIPAKTFPVPKLPVPCFIALGRVWLLHEISTPRRQLCIHHDGTVLGLTGRYISAAHLKACWEEEIREHITAAVSGLPETLSGREEPPELKAVRAELHDQGFVLRNNLLYFPGPPPRLGCLLAPHFNASIGRWVAEIDVAVTSALSVPPDPGKELAAYERKSGGWRPLRLPHGICLRKNPQVPEDEVKGVKAARYLRAVAEQVRANGRFHEQD